MRGGAAVENERHLLLQIGGDVAGLGGAHRARAVGRGRGERAAGRLEQRLRDGVVGHAQRHRVEAGRDQLGQGRPRLAIEHQRQRPGPESVGEALGERRHAPVRVGVARFGHVHDQRIEARAALGGENRGDRVAVGGVAAEPVDRLGGKGDEAASAQKLRRGRNRAVRCLDDGHVVPSMLTRILPASGGLG